MAEAIRGELDEIGWASEIDGAGNVVVRIEGELSDAPRVCISAHMDEIGAVVTKIDADGNLLVGPSGRLAPWKIGECPVQIIGDGEPIVGVLSMGSAHGGPVSKISPGWDGVKIITGLSPEALSAAGIRPGSSVVPTREVRGPVFFGDEQDPLVGAWTFDDRMGVVALLRMLKTVKERSIKPHRPTIIAFTVHEEGGGHGAKILCDREKPEVFVAVDGCPIPPGTSLEMDGRPGIWSKDTVAHYDQRLVADLLRTALEAGTELQPVVYDAAASDASLVYATGGAERIACIGQVRENSHGYEVARLSVFDNIYKILVKFIETWQG